MIQLHKFLIIFFVIILMGLLLFIFNKKNLERVEKFERGVDLDMNLDNNKNDSNSNSNIPINLVKCDQYPSLCSKPKGPLDYNPYLERRSPYITDLYYKSENKRYSPADPPTVLPTVPPTL